MNKLKNLKRLALLPASAFMVLTGLFATPNTAYAEIPEEKPKLILFLPVDGMRGDMIWRYKDRFGESGLRYLLRQGAVYKNAHFQHAATFTAIGHATLATGGNASQHGIMANDWFDRATGKRVYSAQDKNHVLIGKLGSEWGREGTSPRNMLSSTFGDELVINSGYKSRVFAVAIKDRGAIFPGGHMGKAFWYGADNGKMISSTFYYKEYPDWVKKWNEAKHADKLKGKKWELMHPKSTYTFGDMDDRPGEASYKKLGKTFPHPLDNSKSEDFYKSLRFTPYGDELVVDFAKELIDQEKLGQGSVTDMLSVGFSAYDYIGHAFGPNSLELEDMTLRLDAMVADLLSHVDKTIGLDKTLIIFSADHGMADNPEFKKTLNVHSGRFQPADFVTKLNFSLQKRFDTSEKLLDSFWNPSFYLNRDALEKTGLDVSLVEKVLAEEVLKIPGFAIAVTRTDLIAGNVPDNHIMRLIQRGFHPMRSGNVVVAPEPDWFLGPNETKFPNQFASMHGSPYAYDTYVPLIFAGPGIKPQVVTRRVGPEDIASTVAVYLSTNIPSGSMGEPLREVVE